MRSSHPAAARPGLYRLNPDLSIDIQGLERLFNPKVPPASSRRSFSLPAVATSLSVVS